MTENRLLCGQLFCRIFIDFLYLLLYNYPVLVCLSKSNTPPLVFCHVGVFFFTEENM